MSGAELSRAGHVGGLLSVGACGRTGGFDV